MWWTADKLVYELAGGVARSVADALGEFVSIKDFGADGLGGLAGSLGRDAGGVEGDVLLEGL